MESKLKVAYERDVNRKDKLISAMQSLSAEAELDQLFTSVIQHARVILEAQRGTLFIVDAENDELYSKVQIGSS